MNLNHDFRPEPTDRRHDVRRQPQRRFSPEIFAITGIVASFWIFVIVRLIVDAQT